MVQSDNRLAALEDEMKLLKTEISRTLIDLRTLVMTETTPFREERTGRLSDRGSYESPPTVGTEPSEAVRQVAPEAAPADPSGPSQPQQPAVTAQQQQPVPAGPAYSAPPVSQVPQPSAYPGAASGDQERQLIEQERRIAEQDRRMAEQDRRMADMNRGVSPRDMGPPQNWNAEYERERDRTSVPDLSRPSTPDHGESGRHRRREQQDNAPDWPGQPNHTDDLSPSNAGINGERYTQEQEPDEVYDPRGQNVQGNPVYDEYAELFMETREHEPRAERNLAPHGVDVNLLSCLLGWTSMAKRRVGQQRLNDIVGLYLHTRGSSAGLKELLTLISDTVEEVPQGDDTGPQECVDLLAQLHGILAQDLPMIDIPRMQSAVSE